MTKKLIALIAAILMLVVCLAACQTEEEISTPEDNSTAATTTTAGSSETDPTDPVEGDPTDPTDPVEGDPTAPTEDPSTGETQDPNAPTTRTTRPPTTTKAVPTTAKPTYTTIDPNKRTLAKDDIKDMDGYSFKFSSSWLPKETDENITLFEQQLFDRAKEVEEDYNCSIDFTSFWAGPAEIKTYIQANRNPADIMEGMVGSQFYPSVGAGYLKSWTSYVDGGVINTSDARWVDSYTELGRYPLDKNQIYGMQFMRPAEVRFCLVMNKTLLKSVGKNPDDLYAAVKSKTWTFDMLREYTLAATKDTDSNGVNDIWGMTGNYSYMMYGFMWANGGRVVDVVNGKVTCTMAGEKVINGVEYLNKLINEDKVVYFPEDFYSEETWGAAGSYDSIKRFLEGNTAFLFYESWVINQQVKPNAKFDYGMLPLPMGPDATSYVTPSDNARLCYIATTNKNADKSIVIFNALARPLDDLVDYSDDLQAEYFQANDVKSKDMYYFCLENAIGDLGSGVTALNTALTHAMARSLFWHQDTPTAVIRALDGNYNAEIAAIYGN